ncbi:MAG: hypothetical protein JRI54_00170 [Deltaproteobacteria bacterium]|nr:hypothetical protein [Deltaproteobacteria bacterium]
MEPAHDIALALQQAGLGTLGVDIFKGPVRPANGIPVDSIFVLATGGRAGQRIHSDRSEIRYPTAQIRVRAESFAEGYEKASAVYDALFDLRYPGYMDFLLLQSEPIYLGQDANGNYEWSLNVECSYS